MNWRKFIPAHSQPAWGGLIWAVPMIYIFIEPYQRRLGWVDWALTSTAFAAFLALYTLGLIFWNQKRELLKVCAGAAVLAIVFTIYSYTGIVFFAMVAAFAPFAVDGHIPRAAGLLVAIALLPILEWWLLGLPYSLFPVFVAVEALVIGAGTTFVARQTISAARLHRVAERERIARDLHDILGHTLSVITLKSELAGRLMYQDPQRAHEEIRHVERISRKALTEVREVIRGYHIGDMPAEFERLKSTLSSAGIATSCEWVHATLPPTQERILTLVLREAVTNIVRHSQAKNCRISLQQTEGVYRLEIHDDGRGGLHDEGLGIRGMRARVESIGGRLLWRAGPGTSLHVILPSTANAGSLQ